ncbi:tyrosine protein kinase, putative [Entamoeba invadens IP1]|uniref:tyrosine protein kinase, putative n=1 Tax=Entamoeba invadens IP1 TaxID=370355 RepID=UPI0002C3E7AC|nr:tyrosine protein kinase, putative [Entamoeba invadens IP1]ELP90668.1 tyrosine protein kinase, putative [Entamoeba invadens IP1]|eukprot:XP_004257439.1 tyrosine protein kinase, putative [Entamoeba invadens IP1]
MGIIKGKKKGKEQEVGNIVVPYSEVQKCDAISKDSPHGEVYISLFKKTKTVVKILNKTDQSKFKEDTDTLKKIFHPNIILIMGVCVEKSVTAVIMESMKCNMYSVIYEPTRCPKALQNLTQLSKFKILREIAVGLAFVQTVAHVFHGDLKLNNILFDDSGKVKISDLYYTAYRTPTKKDKESYYVCGKTGNLYQAPEVWSGSAPTQESDIYSFALIIIEFLEGKATFYGDQNIANDAVIAKFLELKSQIKIPDEFSPSLKEILKGALKYNPKERPTIDAVLKQFDEIVVDSTMKSKDAIAFWRKNYTDGEVPMYEIPYEDMLEAIPTFPQSSTEAEAIAEEIAKYFPAEGTVSAVDFDTVVNWFGPFFGEQAIFDEMLKIAQAQYFAGLIDKKVAEGRLSGKVDGTYLVRMSTTDPIKSPFTITRNANGSSKHHRIERKSYKMSDEIRYSSTIDKKTYSSKTLPGLLEALKQSHIITVEDDGQETGNYGTA